MVRRTTIELDDRLVERARRALGTATTRATVEEALRRAADHADAVLAEKVDRQRRFLETLDTRLDPDVLARADMWH
jgi:Arc/MetJ family transcription regulator